jgi:hypothetical protein
VSLLRSAPLPLPDCRKSSLTVLVYLRMQPHRVLCHARLKLFPDQRLEHKGQRSRPVHHRASCAIFCVMADVPFSTGELTNAQYRLHSTATTRSSAPATSTSQAPRATRRLSGASLGELRFGIILPRRCAWIKLITASLHPIASAARQATSS